MTKIPLTLLLYSTAITHLSTIVLVGTQSPSPTH